MSTREIQLAEMPVDNRDEHQAQGEESNHLLRTTAEVSTGSPMNPCLKKYILKCAIGASVTSLLLGFDVGMMSDGWAYTKKDKRISERDLEKLGAILHLVSLFGSILAAQTSNWLGRQPTILLTGVFFFLGTLVMGISTNNGLLLTGRILTQFGVGFAPMVASIYIAEVSPPSLRGSLTAIPEVSTNFGTLLGCVVNYFTSKSDLDFGRYIMIGNGIISVILLTIGACVLPESPRWLIMKGRLVDARRVLAKTSESEEEAALRFAKIMEAVGIPVDCNEDVVQVNGEGVWENLCHPTPAVCHMLLCTIGIHLLQQACGIDTLLLYSPRIVQKADVTSLNGKLIVTISVQIVKTVSSFILTFLIDSVGRRNLLLYNTFGLIASFIFLGVGLTCTDNNDTRAKKPEWAMAMIIPSLLFCVAFYSVGLGPIPSVYTSEMFPVRFRAHGYAIGLTCSQLLSAILSIAFLWLYEAITLGGAAFLFTGITIIAWWFVYTVMPETRGQKLEDMWRFFGEFSVWRSAARDTKRQGNSEATARGVDGQALPYCLYI